MLMRLAKRRGQKGFTLIELLIVVAIIGIIAAILIPNLLDALQKAKQKATVGDIRNIGTAWMSWVTDQMSAAAAGAAASFDWDVGQLTLDHTDMADVLEGAGRTSSTSRSSQQNDGWGGASSTGPLRRLTPTYTTPPGARVVAHPQQRPRRQQSGRRTYTARLLHRHRLRPGHRVVGRLLRALRRAA